MCNFPDLNRFLLKPDLSGKAGVDHVKAWLEYEAGYYCEGDPDSSCEARDFYTIMWEDFLNDTGFELRPKPRGFSRNPDKYVQGDWMCSVWTTVKYGLKQAYKKWFLKTEDTFDVFLKNFDDFGEVFGDTHLQEFIRSAYTYANLIIVPDGFNSARNLPTKDYWDRTLKRYYKDKKSLKYKGKDVSTPFRRLLDESKKQNDALCLSPWKIEDYNPIPFSNSVETDWLTVMEKMTERIIERRKQMHARINKLMKQQH